MAARRFSPTHDARTREKIQTSQLINRLQENAMGSLKNEMSPGQVKSAEILLRKTIPDISSVTVSGDPDAPLVAEIRMVPVSGK